MFETPYLPFDEDHLPPGQEPIETSSVQQLATLARQLMISRRATGYSAIGVVTGVPGVGKSIALRSFLQKQARQVHTGLPACIEIRVKPDSTPKAFVEDLLLRLEDERAPRLEPNRYRLADRAADIIVSHDIQLILVDEAEQLNESGFEFLRYLFGKTGCPLVLIGDGRILRMLDRQPKFSSRTGPYQDFLPPSDEELISTVLPQLKLPHWTFDPTRIEDQKMGHDLWFRAKRSFRNLRVILQFASSIASLDDDVPCITLDFLTQYIYPLLRLQGGQPPLLEGKAASAPSSEGKAAPTTPTERKEVPAPPPEERAALTPPQEEKATPATPSEESVAPTPPSEGKATPATPIDYDEESVARQKARRRRRGETLA